MLKKILVMVYISSFLLFIYGVYKNFMEVEPNSCDMTYMFDVPQFKKIHVTNKKFFSNYGLYYYYEGKARIDIKSLNGAPVLYVPGNGGSYRQARSLASVAIRMGMQSRNNVHLDYFTIDYSEELSAFYGGYLGKQKKFLQLCIRAIAKLYRMPSNETVKIAIIGHSMGGIVAKSVLCEEKFAKHIESIIFLSTPIDRPVVNFDTTMNEFYEYSNIVLREKRKLESASSDTALGNKLFREVLLVSIGGGVRDLQVPAWLTTSRYSNIHAMTSAIPSVWLSCDHLSIVWCLQLMKVINRFLFSIVIRQPDNYISFKHDFSFNFQSASKHFLGYYAENIPNNQISFNGEQNNDTWLMETDRQSYKVFKNGLEKYYNQLFSLNMDSINEGLTLFIEILHNESQDWLYGCAAEETQSGVPTCKKIISLANHIRCIQKGKQKKMYALLDMMDIVKTKNDWTHILVRLPATKKAVSMLYDIYNPTERSMRLKALGWLDIVKEPEVLTTSEGALYFQLIIENVTNAQLAIQLNLQMFECSTEHGDIAIKTSVSWAKGFDEYHTFSATEKQKPIVVNAPIENSSDIMNLPNNIYIDVFLEPNCRLSVSQQFSFQHTMRRLIQRFFASLPAHLTVALIVVLAQHCSEDDLSKTNLFKKVLTGCVQYESMLLAILCHAVKSFLANAGVDNSTYTLFVTVMLQGTAIIVSILIALSVSALITLSANVLMFIAPRLSHIFEYFSFGTIFTPRLALGIAIVSISLVTCRSIGLVLAYIVYFLWLAIEYKELLLLRSSSTVEPVKPLVPEDVPLGIRKKQNNFLLHLKLLQVLLVLTIQNGVEVLAWIIKYPHSKLITFDTQAMPIVLLLMSWTFFWEMEDLADLYGNKTISILLYISAVACMLYSQENMFILNYIISFVYISFLLLGSLYKLKQFTKTLRKAKQN